jgi:mannose-6-phosphate isomerase-like protein (cupin superfamily)
MPEWKTMGYKPDVAADYLPQLNEAVAQLITTPGFPGLVDTLKKQLQDTSEPFVWSTIDLESITAPHPESIKSCWIFVLKKDMPSGCHFHPNSIQHMVMIEGEGTSDVGGISREMKCFGESDSAPDDVWYVIPEGTPHEFFPRDTDVVVVSFHTCEPHELQEISCDSGAMREYEPLKSIH